MATITGRARTATGAGTLAALLLVLAFGNQAYADWAAKQNSNDTGGLFLKTLAWPQWRFSPDASVRDFFAADLRAILLVVFTALLLRVMVPSGFTSNGFFSSWGAYMLAGAFAALIARFLGEHPTLLAAIHDSFAGAAYGLLTGWIVGIATATSKASVA
jgi:hypothetical protein